VRRPRGPNAPFVEDLLLHLERVGFGGAPRFLGVDERGRQILTYVEGEVVSETWTAVLPDARLVSAARLLRAFHDATAGSELAGDDEVVCHRDAGPWNTVWRGDDAVALFDFDEATPGARLDDLGYALWKHLNPGKAPLGVREQARRLRVMADEYGIDAEPAVLVRAMAEAQARIQAAGVAGGWSREAMEWLADEREWLARHGSGLA
jgi:aminoglycoside phosphotransferase (APT) family kinase protein